MLASLVACGHGAPEKPPASRSPARSSTAPRRSGTSISASGPIVGEYAVHYDGHDDLQVEASFAPIGSRLAVESRAETFVEGLEVSADAAPLKWTRAPRDGQEFIASACAIGRCRVRYRYRLREAARRLDNVDIASEEGEVLEAPPSTWLLAPQNGDPDARIRLRVTTAEGTRFETGVFRSHDVEGARDIALGDLWTSPYTVFGPLRVRRIERGAPIDLAIGPGKLTVTDDELARWTDDAARAIVGYFGRFPLPEALVIVLPGRGRWIGEGRTLAGGGGAIFVRVGEKASAQALRDDWVLVHEMVHLTFPSVAREHDWAEEGLATYVEPFARARAGLLGAEDAWTGLIAGLPNGLPGPNDRGLDQTPTWGRTYWGGALFYLLADIEIRRRTSDAKGLEHALRGILAEGGDNTHRWPLDDAFAAGDRATGVPVLRELHNAMGTSPHPIHLEEMWRQLGIVRTQRGLRFDDSAPLAVIRRAMTAVD